MREPKDWTPAERAVSRARAGRFLDELPGLLDLARAPGGDRGETWVATSAAVQILQWQDAFTEAADLAESLIVSDGPLGGELCDQGEALLGALLAAEIRAGVPARPRFAALAPLVPEGRVLRNDIDGWVELLATAPATANENRWFGWGQPLRAPDEVIGGWFLDRDYRELTRAEKFTYWSALHQTRDVERAERIHRETGELPEQYQLCLWMAGGCALRGDPATGEDLLLAAHDRHWPFDTASALPTEPVVNSYLRPLVTDRVREYYLTTPIGPEAKDRTAQS